MKRTALALAAAALLLASCSTDSDDSAPSSTSSPAPTTTTTTSSITSPPPSSTEPSETTPTEVITLPAPPEAPSNESDTSNDDTISSSLIIDGGVCYDFEVGIESGGLSCTVTDPDGTSRWTATSSSDYTGVEIDGYPVVIGGPCGNNPGMSVDNITCVNGVWQ